jgi:hypothetical protein
VQGATTIQSGRASRVDASAQPLRTGQQHKTGCFPDVYATPLALSAGVTARGPLGDEDRYDARSRLVPRANPVAVGIVAAAASVVGASRSSAHSGRTDRRRTDTVAPIPIAAAIAVAPITSGYSPAPHCDCAAAPRSSNCDSAAAVGSATATITATSASPSIGIVWDQTGGEQNKCCESSKTVTEHEMNLPTNSASSADCGALNPEG